MEPQRILRRPLHSNSLLLVKKAYLKNNQITLNLKNPNQSTSPSNLRRSTQSNILVPKPLFQDQYSYVEKQPPTLYKINSVKLLEL